jgi:predicted transcriptional regulator
VESPYHMQVEFKRRVEELVQKSQATLQRRQNLVVALKEELDATLTREAMCLAYTLLTQEGSKVREELEAAAGQEFCQLQSARAQERVSQPTLHTSKRTS